ncbi:hypothetical protein [Marinomonas posidonica]|uniref:hypothetical protein n=1 Tax=Marinomonas posidonica TaxID=936476 RepID=UPI0037370190
MLFIEALNRASTKQTDRKFLARSKPRLFVSNKDSVDLSSAAHQVKEIHVDSDIKESLTASSSIFANLLEHVLGYLIQSNIQVYSPEELDLDQKDWKLFLQVPPTGMSRPNSQAGYGAPEVRQHPPAKQLIFHIPVKPAYGLATEMTLLISPHQGSPEVPSFFYNLPKETRLPTLNTPYPPEFIEQQVTHHHILLDQDGEADQLSPLYAQVNQSKLEEDAIPPAIHGLRIWKAKNRVLTPAILGDQRIGLVFIGHHKPLDSSIVSDEERARRANNLYTKA